MDEPEKKTELERLKWDIDTLYGRCDALKAEYHNLAFVIKVLIGGWSALLFLIVIVSALR